MCNRITNQPSRKLHPSQKSRSPLKLCFLHGFLGEPTDWAPLLSFLPGYECVTLSYPFIVPSDALLIGYSMGGRIALKYPNPKIILSAHPGLIFQDEKEAQAKKEEMWIELLQNLPFLDFLKAWYAQPLFDTLREHPDFPQIFNRRLHGSREMALKQLTQERLSVQPKLCTDNALFLYGENDLKYAALYSRLNLNTYAIERSGHAIHLENPAACASLILERSCDLYRHHLSQTGRDCKNYDQSS